MSSSLGSLPIFVFPLKLEFYLNEVSSLKSTISIYNPYDFALRYKLYSNVQKEEKYKVTEPEGVIKSKCCVDIVVRHQQPYPHNVRKTDRFRVKILKDSNKTPIAQRDIPATLYSSKRDSPQDNSGERFEQVPAQQRGGDSTTSGTLNTTPGTIERPQSPEPFMILIATVCIAILAMPCHGEQSEILPDYCRVTQAYKLVAAFVLGMVTTSVFKP